MPRMLALDPLLSGDVDLGRRRSSCCSRSCVAFALLLVAVMFMVWFERKVIADMQNRIGPDRAGPWGILQTLADGIKLFFKEDLHPERGRPLRLPPGAVPVGRPRVPDVRIVPIGGDFTDGDDGASRSSATTPTCSWPTRRSASCFLLAMSSIAVYGVMLAGWSSGSKYPLLGSVRASAQMVTYEAALGLSVAAVVLLSRLAVDPRHRRPGQARLGIARAGTSSPPASCRSSSS